MSLITIYNKIREHYKLKHEVKAKVKTMQQFRQSLTSFIDGRFMDLKITQLAPFKFEIEINQHPNKGLIPETFDHMFTSLNQVMKQYSNNINMLIVQDMHYVGMLARISMEVEF